VPPISHILSTIFGPDLVGALTDGVSEVGDSPSLAANPLGGTDWGSRTGFSVRYGTWAGSGLLGAEAEKNKAEQAGPEEQASAQCGYPDLTSPFV
jgi:hypothetical protein